LKKHPKRFVGFIGVDVSLPPDKSIAEIRRCIAVPGF
jgi:predicted TIM-barrel fold metal-dependent hydrolase